MTRWVWAALGLAGCWKVDRASIAAGDVDFAPDGTTVEGWVVRESAVDLQCPDGLPARVLLVHPVAPEALVPTAVLYPSGSFDWVLDPTPGSPLDGAHHVVPGRLDMPWAVRQAYATLGMYPSQTPGEVHTGALPARFADAGVAVVVPINCWGDWWHNIPGEADNDFEGDLFFRNGRALAEWSFRALAEPDLAASTGMELTFEPDPDALFAVGLGEGGRAVGELLHLGLMPRAVAIDSLVDDLATLAPAQPATAVGLDRVFPDGDFDAGAMHSAPELPPTVWVHSPIDAALPAGSQDKMLDRLELSDAHLRLDGSSAGHVLSNGDPVLAEAVVRFLLAAEPGPAGADE